MSSTTLNCSRHRAVSTAFVIVWNIGLAKSREQCVSRHIGGYRRMSCRNRKNRYVMYFRSVSFSKASARTPSPLYQLKSQMRHAGFVLTSGGLIASLLNVHFPWLFRKGYLNNCRRRIIVPNRFAVGALAPTSDTEGQKRRLFVWMRSGMNPYERPSDCRAHWQPSGQCCYGSWII